MRGAEKISAAPMGKRGGLVLLAAAAGLAILAAGCSRTAAGSGSFDRELSVTGPVRLELQGSSGNVLITAGDPGHVSVRGEFRVYAWPWENAGARIEELSKNPPVEQRGNIIHIGTERMPAINVSVDYTIIVPADTELRAIAGSGNLEVRGIHGPVILSAGSGTVRAAEIGDDIEAKVGSGELQLTDVKGSVRFSLGSGDLLLQGVQGDIRGSARSGDIKIERPGRNVSIQTGSGDVTVSNASRDVRLLSGSGTLNVQGNPEANSYWELSARSGDISVEVPRNASFRFHAETKAGDIQAGFPLTTEDHSEHELHAHAGNGAARIEARTSSGRIGLR